VLALLVEVSTLDLSGSGSGQLPTGQRQMQHPVVMVVFRRCLLLLRPRR
jgi:hypothetical protein